MIFDQRLSSGNDDHDVFDPAVDAFLDKILERRFVNDRDKFLRNRFSRGKHSRSETRGKDNCLFYFHTNTSFRERFSVLSIVYNTIICIKAESSDCAAVFF